MDATTRHDRSEANSGETDPPTECCHPFCTAEGTVWQVTGKSPAVLCRIHAEAFLEVKL